MPPTTRTSSDWTPEKGALYLFDLRERVAFTYHAHFEYVQTLRRRQDAYERYGRFLSTALGGGFFIAAIQQAPDALASLLPTRIVPLLPWAFSVIGGGLLLANAFVATEASQCSKQAEVAQKAGQNWLALYNRANQLRNGLGAGLVKDQTEFITKLGPLEEEKSALDASEPRTDDNSYASSTAKLNNWWYRSEKEAHRSFGWDPELVRST